MDLGRRDWLKYVAGGGAGLAVAGLLDVPQARAAAGKLRISHAKEYTTACNFCSVGCGMLGRVKDGELLTLEGDPDHVINGGSLCAKGSAMVATHTSPRRLQTPRYRAPGSDHWQDITWEEAIARIARKVKSVRDTTWVATEKDAAGEHPVHRTDGIGFLGGAQSTNEECYLWNKMGRLFGTSYVEHQARL